MEEDDEEEKEFELESELGLMAEENWERDERDEVMVNSRSDGRRGVRRRPENQPRREVL
jgi:hypothetical protein